MSEDEEIQEKQGREANINLTVEHADSWKWLLGEKLIEKVIAKAEQLGIEHEPIVDKEGFEALANAVREAQGSRKIALEKINDSKASGQAVLSGSEALGEGNTSYYPDMPLGFREYDSYDSMIDDLKLLAQSETEEGKQAQAYLKALMKKGLKQRIGQVELEGDLTKALREKQNKGKKPTLKKVKGE